MESKAQSSDPQHLQCTQVREIPLFWPLPLSLAIWQPALMTFGGRVREDLPLLPLHPLVWCQVRESEPGEAAVQKVYFAFCTRDSTWCPCLGRGHHHSPATHTEARALGYLLGARGREWASSCLESLEKTIVFISSSHYWVLFNNGHGGGWPGCY